jgi:hypothetical protein
MNLLHATDDAIGGFHQFGLAGFRDHMDGGFVIVHCSCFLYNQKNSRKIIDRNRT